MPQIRHARVHFNWESMRVSLSNSTAVRTRRYVSHCGRCLECCIVVLKCRYGATEWSCVRRADAALELYSNWIIDTTHVLNDLERNAIHRESGYTKHIGVSSTSCEVGSAIFLERVCCLDLLSFTVDRKKGCTVVCDSQNNCARIPLNSYHTPACSAMAS